nr:hypothetical protein Iba_chr03cCG0580 [Ipomoea batatas]
MLHREVKPEGTLRSGKPLLGINREVAITYRHRRRKRRPVGASPPVGAQEARELHEMVRQPEMRYGDCALMHSKMPKRRSGGGTTTGTTVVWVGSSVGTVRIGQYSVREVCRLLGLIDHAGTGKY